MPYHEHHYRNLERGNTGLIGFHLSLSSALEVMENEDRAEIEDIQAEVTVLRNRLQAARKRASARFDFATRHPDFARMQNGEIAFPDEKLLPPEPLWSERPKADPDDLPEYEWFPSALTGKRLVEEFGSIEAAIMANLSGSSTDDIAAYIYVTTGEAPPGWKPPSSITVSE